MIEISDNYISTINIAGLRGRLLKIPAQTKKEKEILLLYGVHSSLERMYSNAQFHSRYGNVVMPDMPGFGGMDSFHKIGREPNLDSYADYLYTFMKSYKLDQKKIRIVAMSFGFLVVTRLLQKHPELTVNIDFVVSFVGFGKSSDFSNKILEMKIVRLANIFGASKAGSELIGILIFNRFSLRAMFTLFRLFNPKYQHENQDARREATEMELDLWSKNDTRTRFFTYKLLSNFDLTKNQKPIKLTEHNLTTDSDQYFDAMRVKQTLKKLYTKNYEYIASMPLHAPSIIGTEEDVADIFPPSMKRVLRK